MDVCQHHTGMMNQGCSCNLFVKKNLHDVLHNVTCCHVDHNLGILSVVGRVKQVDVFPGEGNDCHVAEEDEKFHFQELAENVGLSAIAEILITC